MSRVKSKPEPYLRPHITSIGDIEGAMGARIPVPADDVPAMVDLLLDTLPLECYRPPHLPFGFKLESKPRVKFKIVNRLTLRTNARIGPRYEWAEGGEEHANYWLMTIYRPGLNVKTIIHEVAHIPAHGDHHGPTFKKWQRYLQDQWFRRG